MKTSLPILILFALGMAGLACERAPETVSPLAPSTSVMAMAMETIETPVGELGDPIVETHDTELHDSLEDLFNGHDWRYVYFSQVIDPDEGGIVKGVVDQWYDGCLFTLEIPDGAIVGDEPVEITMGIPIQSESDATAHGPDAVFQFEPDGMKFAKELRLTASFPPWLDPGDKIFHFYCIDKINEVPPHYSYSYHGSCDPTLTGGRDPGSTMAVHPGTEPPAYFDSWEEYFDACTGLTFAMDHFSRWQTVAGTGDGGGKGDWPWPESERTCCPVAEPVQALTLVR